LIRTVADERELGFSSGGGKFFRGEQFDTNIPILEMFSQKVRDQFGLRLGMSEDAMTQQILHTGVPYVDFKKNGGDVPELVAFKLIPVSVPLHLITAKGFTMPTQDYLRKFFAMNKFEGGKYYASFHTHLVRTEEEKQKSEFLRELVKRVDGHEGVISLPDAQ